MPDLIVEDLDETTLARLEGLAAARHTTVQSLARDILRERLGVTDRARWGDDIRALRAQVAKDPDVNTVALLRAEREARSARILGEDDAEAWAAAYRSAL